MGLNGQAGGPGKSAGCMGSERLRHPQGAVMCTWFGFSQHKPFVSPAELTLCLRSPGELNLKWRCDTPAPKLV